MGHASLGPILIGGTGEDYGRGGITLLDTKSFQVLTLPRTNTREFECHASCIVRASANGRVFTSYRTQLSPSGFYTLVLNGSTADTHYDHDSLGPLLPSADGSRIYTSRGVYSNKTAPLGAPSRDEDGSQLLPAATGDYVLRIEADQLDPSDYSREIRKAKTVKLHLAGDPRPIVTLSKLLPPRPTDQFDRESSQLDLDERLFYLPELSTLAYVVHPDNAIEFLTLDLDQELAKSGVDFLFVSSRPPAAVEAGRPFGYQVVVKSKQGNAKISLASGPEGMQVIAGGKVAWTPTPEDRGEHSVIVAVSDASGQEVFQTFRVTVLEPRAPPTAGTSKGTSKATVGTPGASSAPATTAKVNAPSAKPSLAPLTGTAPTAKPSALTPAKLTGETAVIKLPAVAERMEVGGSGRYLILYLKSLRKLAVLDICEAKIAGYIPADDDRVAYSAGDEKLVISLGEKNVITRWSLATLQRELTVPSPSPNSDLALGCASGGPVLTVSEDDVQPDGSNVQFLDLSSFRPLPLEAGMREFPIHAEIRVGPRVSADGRTFCIPAAFGLVAVTFDGQKLHVRQSEHQGDRLGIPSPDGQVIYCGTSRFTQQLRELSKGREEVFGCLIPAVSGRLYLATLFDQRLDPYSHRGEAFKHKLAVHIDGDSRPLVQLDNFKVLPTEACAG
jgi:hypothetical protein